jgi:hypothetical protein
MLEKIVKVLVVVKVQILFVCMGQQRKLVKVI